MAYSFSYPLASLAGVLMHILVFRVGEWDVASLSILVYHVLAALVTAWTSHTQLQIPATEVARWSCCYVAGLYLSMLVYRACFHRLCEYPGPFLARFTNFYITARLLKKLCLFEEVQKLHAEYGDYVRLGPSELSIADPEAVQAIYGTQSPTTKGPWYSLLEPRTPLFMARDKKEHARRRKVWDQGFSTKALLGYDYRVTQAINDFLRVLDRDHKQPINVTKWFSFFGFDVMEDLAFNKASNLLRDGEEKYIFKTIRKELNSIAVFGHLLWLMPLLKKMPILNSNYLQLWSWIQAQIDERIKNEPDQPDIFSWLLADFNQNKKTKVDRWNLNGDVQLIVVAGSDTTAVTLTHIFFELAYDKNLVNALQKEFDALPSLAHDNLMKIPLLEAVINETLRLHPPVPSGTQRMTPPEGMQIGERRIPGNIIVQVPSYTVFRDPRAFEEPTAFIPERWTTRQDLIKNRSVFIPFNTGNAFTIFPQKL
ncbi:Cytochrome P450 [Trichoderma cornu-damae]|uniref:Cytochrome P450 n=1 Tax=Trichoderma cornu-damae TaxID=654480 RepID=A0A9P8QND8_9HYPO|nr:Cytochrome P450 [Trichoderma cornu-damae]